MYERNSLDEIIKETTKNIFVPITVSGGIRSVDNVNSALRSGADKVAINTAAIKNPSIISKVSNKFGSSTIVLSLQAKKIGDTWEAYFDNGRERSYLDAVEWVKKAEGLGVGEIMVTSIDNDGTGKGFDIELIESIMNTVEVPVIASGGMGSLNDLGKLLSQTTVDAIAIGRCLHYDDVTIKGIKEFCKKNNFPIRVNKEQ